MSTIKVRRGVNASLPAGGTVAGEPRFSTDTGQLYIDDGTNNVEITPNATNVTAAGALMDSELTDIASVKALNQGVATTDSPTFVGGTFTGTLAGRDQTLTVANTDNKVGLTVTQNDTTNNPNGVTVTNAGTGNALFIDHNNSGKAINIDMDANSASSATGLHVNVANAGAGGAYAAIFEAGNVGIGTTAPDSNLHISSGSTTTLKIENTTNGESQLNMYSSTSYTRLFYRHSAGDFGIYHKLATRFRITTSGNIGLCESSGSVGIGTTAPSATLDVVGAVEITGSNGSLTLSSSTDGGEFNIGSSATGTLALYGSSGNTLHVSLLDGNLTVAAGSLIKATSSPPASAGATGTTGQIEWDSSYIYICIASNTWRRVAHATW